MKKLLLNKITIYTLGILMALTIIIKLFFRSQLTDSQIGYITGFQGILLILFVIIEIVRRVK